MLTFLNIRTKDTLRKWTVSRPVLKPGISKKSPDAQQHLFVFPQNLKAYWLGFKKWERKKQAFQGQLFNFLIMSILKFRGAGSIPVQCHLKGTNWKDFSQSTLPVSGLTMQKPFKNGEQETSGKFSFPFDLFGLLINSGPIWTGSAYLSDGLRPRRAASGRLGEIKCPPG